MGAEGLSGSFVSSYQIKECQTQTPQYKPATL